LDETQAQLNQSLEELKKQEAEVKRLQSQSESRGSELDDLRLQLAMTNAELQKIQNSSAVHLDSLRKQVSRRFFKKNSNFTNFCAFRLPLWRTGCRWNCRRSLH
jgi:DNA repair exonuclease SbcCD ATPase subunit